MFYPANNKANPIKFEDARDEESIINFIKKHSTFKEWKKKKNKNKIKKINYFILIVEFNFYFLVSHNSSYISYFSTHVYNIIKIKKFRPTKIKKKVYVVCCFKKSKIPSSVLLD